MDKYVTPALDVVALNTVELLAASVTLDENETEEDGVVNTL